MSDEKIIFMNVWRLTRFTLHKKTSALKIYKYYISFFTVRKVGILGLNRACKSPLRCIIVGKDTDYQCEVVFSPEYPVGMPEQKPEPDSEKTVIEVVCEKVNEINDLLKEYKR